MCEFAVLSFPAHRIGTLNGSAGRHQLLSHNERAFDVRLAFFADALALESLTCFSSACSLESCRAKLRTALRLVDDWIPAYAVRRSRAPTSLSCET